jgi:hypothetical protein
MAFIQENLHTDLEAISKNVLVKMMGICFQAPLFKLSLEKAASITGFI